MFPEVILSLQMEFKYWHENLSNLHTKYMFRLAKPGVFPAQVLDLKYDVPLYPSFIFLTARRATLENRRE